MKEPTAHSAIISQPSQGFTVSTPGRQVGVARELEKILVRELAKKYIQEAFEILQKTTAKRLRYDRLLLCGRMSSTMGLATYNFIGNRYHYTIKISSKIFRRDSVALKDTCYHEVAHLADWQIYRKWGHGDTWCRLMRRLGLEPRIHIEPYEYVEAGYLSEEEILKDIGIKTAASTRC